MTLSADLTASFPASRSFGVRNLRYMRQFGAAWPERGTLQHGVAALPWGHITILLTKLDDRDARDWYAARAAAEGWTRKSLEFNIMTDLRSREGAVVSNFERTLAPEEAASADLLLRDPTVIDFVDAGQITGERSLEEALVADIERFMLALGRGFLYAGRQRALVVGGEEFRLDLLFYHHPSRRWVGIELKTERFRPEYVGKVHFYVNAIDELLAGPEDRATVGFILCTDRNEAAARARDARRRRLMAVSVRFGPSSSSTSQKPMWESGEGVTAPVWCRLLIASPASSRSATKVAGSFSTAQ